MILWFKIMVSELEIFSHHHPPPLQRIYTINRKREYKEAIGNRGLKPKYFIETRAWRSNHFLLSLTESCNRLFSRSIHHMFSSSYPSRFFLAQSQLSFPLNKAHPGVIVSVMIPMVFWREFNATNYRVIVTLPSTTFKAWIMCFICLKLFFQVCVCVYIFLQET